MGAELAGSGGGLSSRQVSPSVMDPAVATVDGDSSPSSAESSFRELDDVFLQTQTRIWLGEVLHARLDEQLNISDLLADGDLLLEVSNVIWNMLLGKCIELRHIKAQRCKPDGSRKISERYMPYSNVDSFLRICKILGMNGIDLFSPSDVVEKRDIRKVCICIRSLSKKARSKQLNVPDFDIVTYTVAMPTNMVECIRRSLEQSLCSYTSSSGSGYSSFKDSRLKYRQKNSVAAFDRDYYSSSEESDEAESNYLENQVYSSSTNSSDDTIAANLVLENSPVVYSVAKRHTPAQCIFQSDILDQEIDEFEHDQNKSPNLAESGKSLCPRYLKDGHLPDDMPSSSIKSHNKLGDRLSHVNNGSRHCHEHDLGLANDDSIVEYSLDENGGQRSISPRLAFPDLTGLETDINNPFLFGDDSVPSLFMSADSCGSSSTQRICQNGIRMRSSNDIEDVEVSSTTSMSSVLGRVLNLEFDDPFDADDFRTNTINFVDLLSTEADNLDEGSIVGYKSQDMAKYKTSVHSLSPDTEETQHEIKFKNFGFSTGLLSPSREDCQSNVMDYHVISNEIGISQRDWETVNSIVAKNDETTVRKNGDDKEVIGITRTGPDTDSKGYANNSIPEDCFSYATDVNYEDSNVSSTSISVGGGGRSCSNLLHEDIMIQDICSPGAHAPNMVAVHQNTVNHNFVIPENNCEPATAKSPCSAVRDSDIVGETDNHEHRGQSEDLLHCDKYIKDECDNENDDILEENILDDRKGTDAGLSEVKPRSMPLLKTFVSGTALVGVLFLVVHLRNRSGREKKGDANKQASQIPKSKVVKFSSQRGQKKGEVDGAYPSEKLKFDN